MQAIRGKKGGSGANDREPVFKYTVKNISIEAENKQSIGIRSGSVNLLAISE